MAALLAKARQQLHLRLFDDNTLSVSQAGVASNADSSSNQSQAISGKVINLIEANLSKSAHTVSKVSGQTLGKQFEAAITAFIQETYPKEAVT